MESYYYNNSTVIKYIRKVLNIINSKYIDNGIRSAFIMKRYVEFYHYEEKNAVNLVLLALLKDIGNFYYDDLVPDCLEKSVLSYTFLKYCSPIHESAKPLLFCGSIYNENINDESYNDGLLLHLIDKVSNLIFLECSLNEIKNELSKDTTHTYNLEHVKKLINLLSIDEDIMQKLDQKNSVYIHETCAYIQGASYSDEELLSFINMANYIFEFHCKENIAHSVTTCEIARNLAKYARLNETQTAVVGLAALVHDIGKVKISKDILSYPGKLSDEDMEIMKKHVIYSKEILEGCFSYQIVEMSYHHHEKLDGSGYPQGLPAKDLTIGDKILAVSDFISALRSKRSYKDRMSIEEVFDELHKEVFLNKLDARIVKHFEKNYEEIIALADEKENEVMDNYNKMSDENEALKNSEALKRFYGLEE